MVLLVGAGGMSIDYAKVLSALKQEFIVVGRGETSASHFEDITGHLVYRGGVSTYIKKGKTIPNAAIVSVGVEHLSDVACELIKFGVKKILVEKPAGLDIDEVELLAGLAEESNSNVYVAYNRRFFSSVLAAKKLIDEDGGVESFNFEVTEWTKVVSTVAKPKQVKENWFLANTSHVSDLAFFLGGAPEEICCFTAGQTNWHKRSANFAGAGRTLSGALFTYNGNWNAPGRWSVEVLTKLRRFIFKPMEELYVQRIDSVVVEKVDVNDSMDKAYKPGLFLQVYNFLNENVTDLCNIQEQLKMARIYCKMAGYL